LSEGARLRNDCWMNARRGVLLATCLVVAGLGGVLVVTQWDQANRIATVAAALGTIAAVGVAVWAGLPGTRAALRVARTGSATAGPGGRATSGVDAPAKGLEGHVEVEDTGPAEASGGGDATSGVRLT
jgi:hypothetical protein